MKLLSETSPEKQFPVTNDEYIELNKKYGKLCWKAAHELKRKNFNNNFIEDTEDVAQDLFIAMMKAGSYTKRQVYIEKSLKVAEKHVNDPFIKEMVFKLADLWDNRKRHGANRQKYGPHQELILDRILEKFVPESERPKKNAPLKINAKFANYCKSIIWNGEKSAGKKITKEKSIRNNLVSLSEFDYLQ